MLGAGAAGLVGSLKDISKSVTSARRLLALVDSSTSHPVGPTAAGPADLKSASVEFDNVSFGYSPGCPVLSGLSFALKPGQVTALVGASGCGKTTAWQILTKLRDPSSGAVRLGGRDIAEMPSDWWRAQVAVVEQNPTLFNASIYENIAFGLKGELASIDQVQAAAKEAMAHEFISEKPQGYQTQVGPGGACLSGGQVQRIAIARALLRRPRVLVFDEATSSIHGQAESEVHSAIIRICQASQERSVLLISHRLHMLKHCDSIHVLTDGRIAQSGTFEQLTAEKQGLFSQMVESSV
eukprot:TRINITY_DN36711_c0_g1_i1.p1 TRINITY_DN36711_c0_g1~~TRINITY_DN36711_c0_g1_i1.p1  ORF type:complete len:296 (-),score=57.79 TRINITY_DN36711_c0_g1_i1:372-1259(-)